MPSDSYPDPSNFTPHEFGVGFKQVPLQLDGDSPEW